MYGIVVTPPEGKADKRRTFVDKCFKDRDGRVLIGQLPNLPLIVCIVAAVLSWPLSDGAGQAFHLISFGALFTWGWLELFAGENYFRRSLGLLAMLALVVAGS